MKKTNVLAIDFGTQSVRVTVYDKEGHELAAEKAKYDPPYLSPLPNYAEQDPESYFLTFCACSKKMAKNHPELLDSINGACLTCFRDSAVLLDKDLEVLRPTILWLDQRNAECKKPLPLFHRFLFALSGMKETIDFNRKRSVSNWIIENEPEIWKKVDKYVNISTYFVYRLTGFLKDSSSNFSGHYPIDFRKKRWYKNPKKHLKGQIFSLEKSMLAEIVKEGEPFGQITKEAAAETGIPEGTILYACGSDKSCETLGLGVLDDRHAAISYGTASTVETVRKRYTESEPFLPGFPSCIPGYYNMDIQIYRGYWMINWFLKEFSGKEVGDIMTSDVSAEDFNSRLSQIPPGCDGLTLQPYWGPGLSRPLAKGAIIGFSDAITRQHFYRAIIEGIAYALREGLEHFEKKIHHRIPELRISGGGSQSDEICQITADIMGRKVVRVQTSETSSLGAAISCMLANGTYRSPEEAVEKMVRPTKEFLPNKEVNDRYNYLYKNVYIKIFPNLSGIYKQIKKFNREEEKDKKK